MYVLFLIGLCFSGWFESFLFQIHDVNFSNDGTKFLCISGTTQAKIFDRDGEEQYVCSLWIWDMIPYPDY